MNKIGWIILIVLFAFMVALILFTPLREAVLAGFAGLVNIITDTAGGAVATVTSMPFWIAYIGPYAWLYGLGIGIIGILVFQRVLWPKRPGFMQKRTKTPQMLVTKTTVAREEPRDIVVSEDAIPTKTKPEEKEALATEPAA